MRQFLKYAAATLLGGLFILPTLALAAAFLVTQGGTAQTQFSGGLLYAPGGTTALNSTSSPVVGIITATSTTATSTFKNGISITGGCFSDAGGCITHAGGGTVSSIATTWPVLGGTITTTGTISWGGLSTTSNLTAGHVVYSSGVGSITDIATTTLGFSGPFSGTSALGFLVGGSDSTVTWTGLATTSQPSSSNLLVSNGGAGVYGVATGTISAGSTQITVTAGRAAVGGALSIDCATASASQAGCLSTTDWSAFNAKNVNIGATSTNPLMATYFVATSSTAASLFPNASTTNLTAGASNYAVNPLNMLPVTIASSTWGSGTTTIPILTNVKNMTLVDMACKTDAGSLEVRIYHGTVNNVIYASASTTINTITFATNNVYTTSTTTFMDIGNAASSPTQFNCTPEYTYNGS